MTTDAMREAWMPLAALHHVKRPVLLVREGVTGWERLATLLGIPAVVLPECDFVLKIDSQQQLEDTILGVQAVLQHEGSFPEFDNRVQSSNADLRKM